VSFREKSAWVTLITLVVLMLFYLTHLPPPWWLRANPSGFLFHVLTIGVIAFVVIELVAYAIMALRAPREARAPQDEREQLIALQARSLAARVYAVLSLGSVFLVIHLGANDGGILYCLFLSFIAAQIVNYAARVIYYRRGR
jgi:heme/copper-type cytochrome/quinol oxidase subunit 2